MSTDDIAMREPRSHGDYQPGHALQKRLSGWKLMLTIAGLVVVSLVVSAGTVVGWTNWLDIAPDGVNKSTALERVRQTLGFSRSRVMAIGDGRNDIEMMQWAAAEGRAVAMGQAPEEVKAHSTEVTKSDREDGVAWALQEL